MNNREYLENLISKADIKEINELMVYIGSEEKYKNLISNIFHKPLCENNEIF